MLRSSQSTIEESFRLNDQHRIVGAGHNELLGDFEGVNKSGTGRFQIKRGGAQRADLSLHQARGRKGTACRALSSPQ